MIFTPFAPSAGPTGGEGLAALPLICNLINPATSLAIFIRFPKLVIEIARFMMINQEALWLFLITFVV
jgi:hypothetical protein